MKIRITFLVLRQGQRPFPVVSALSSLQGESLLVGEIGGGTTRQPVFSPGRKRSGRRPGALASGL